MAALLTEELDILQRSRKFHPFFHRMVPNRWRREREKGEGYLILAGRNR